MHRHRKQLRGRLESRWQDHAPWADNPTQPITKHVIWKTQPQLHQRSQTRGGKLWRCPPRSAETWLQRGFVGTVLGPGEGLWLQLWRLIHCVMRTPGNGITFAEGKEDNAVTPDHSLAANRTRPCQAVSASAFCCTTAPTHSTNHPLPFPPVHQPRWLHHEKVSVCAARTAQRFGRFLRTHLWIPSLDSISGLVWWIRSHSYSHAAHRRLYIIDCVEMIDLEDHLLPSGIIVHPVLFLWDIDSLPIRPQICGASMSC